MKPRLRRWAVGLCCALLQAAAAIAQQPAAAVRPAGEAEADEAVAAYLAAQSRENTLQAALRRASEQADRARGARRDAESLQRQFESARTALTDRGRSLREGRSAILSLRDNETTLSTAIEEEARLADAALEATLDNAAALLRQGEKAKLADDAAERQRAQAESAALAAERVTQSARAWAGASEAVRRHHQDYLERVTALMPMSLTLHESVGALIQDSVTGMARPLQDKQAALVRAAAAVRTQTGKLAPPPAAPDQKASPLVPHGSDARPATGPAWAAAEHDRQIEAQARAWWQASLRSCGNDAACLARMGKEEEQSDRNLKTAGEKAQAGRDDTRSEIERLAVLATQWEEFQAHSEEALRRLDPLAQDLQRLIAAAQDADDDARDIAARTDTAYRAARQAADIAYLAAYHKPREAPEMQQRAAASKSAPRTAMAAAARAPVFAHAFESVTRENLRRMPRYGAYTYVLFAQRPGAAADSVKKNYDALLQAIVAGTAHISAMADWKPETLNLFCIPSLSREMPDRNRYDIKNYDSDLAFALLATAGRGSIITPAILDRLRNSPGPFLLTTFRPLDQTASNDPLFFVDLSPYGPESYPALVASYKEQLLSAPPTGQTSWKPEKLQWAFAAGTTVYADAKKVADGIKKHFEDWTKGQGTKVALVQ